MTTFKFLMWLFIVVIAMLLLGRWLMDKVRGGRVVDLTPEQQAAIGEPDLRVVPVAAKPASGEPITMSLPGPNRWYNLQWLIGLSFLMLMLTGEPETLGSRWLAYPAAAIVGVIMLVLTGITWTSWTRRVVATPAGITVSERTMLVKELRWNQVAHVVLEQRRVLADEAEGTPTRSHTLCLLDARGEALLSLPAPLRPVADYPALLQLIAARTGQPIVRRIVS